MAGSESSARRGQRASIAEVAAAAGVSTTTVSHALSGKRAVSAETTQRVLAAVEELRYRPNRVASSLRQQRTHSVALVVADITNPYYPALARAVCDDLAGDGYVALIGNTDGRAANERAVLAEMVARGVDGVIIRPMQLSATEIREIVGGSTPLVVLREDASDDGLVDRVVTDDARGMAEAVRRLVGSGVAAIGYVGDDDQLGMAGRRSAFEAAMDAAGLQVRPEWVRPSAFTREGGLAAADALLDQDSPPGAVLCGNDLIAIGVLQAARRRGVAVPDELAVIGFDDIETAALMSPALSTVVNPAAEVGHAAAALILDRIADPSAEYRRRVLPTWLVVRETG